MKKRTHKLLSLLLCLVMVLSLLPTAALADGDYADGENCPYCGAYNWGDWKCDGCGGCSADSDRGGCYEDHHCQDCGKCLWDEDEYCESCLTCWTCAEQDGTHCLWCRAESFDICSECGFCEDCIEELDLHCGDCNDCLGEGFNDCDKEHSGDKTLHCTGCAEDWICGNCDKCFFNDQDMFCEDCGNCLECQMGGAHCLNCGACVASEGGFVEESYDATEGYTFCYDCLMACGWICPECDEFTDEDEWCPWCGEETHCAECAEEFICGYCGECALGKGVEICDECGWCEECCRSVTEMFACVHDMCAESSEYEDHLCSECGLCPGYEDVCEDCGRCETCAEDYHCDHGLCPDGADFYDEGHYCEECGECYDFDEICEYCNFCFDCAESMDLHCSCGYCSEGDPDYEDESHLCPGCGEALSCEGYEFCPDCGLCADCAEAETHCEHDICLEGTEWEDHFCVNCEECPGSDDRCEFCGMCESCWYSEDYHCPHGVCLDDPEGCSECGACTHVYSDGPEGSNSHGHWTVCTLCGKHGDMEDHTPVLETVTAPDAGKKLNGVGRYVCEDCGWVMETGVVIPYEVGPHDHEYSATGICTICGQRCEGMWFARQPRDITVTVPDVGLDEQLGMTVSFTVKPRDAKGHTEEDFGYYWEAGYVQEDGTCKFEVVEGSNLVPEEIKDSNPSYFEQPTLVLSVPTDICYSNIRVRCWVGLYNEEIGDYDYYMYSDTADLIGKHNYKYQALSDGGSKYIQLTPDGGTVIFETSTQHQKICVGEGCEETQGAPANHNYNGWLWLYTATDEHTGLKYRVCKDCGYRDYVVTPQLDESHVHNFVYKYNDTVHWLECSCGAKQVLDADGNPVTFPEGMEPEATVYQSSHIYGDWVRTTEPTEDELGEDTATCKVCGYEIYRNVDKLPHTHAFYTLEDYLTLMNDDDSRWVGMTYDELGNPKEGTLQYKDQYVLTGDQKCHYFYCKDENCEKIGRLYPHRMSGWTVITPPTADEDGAAYGECLDCGFYVTVTIPHGSYPISIIRGTCYDKNGEKLAGGAVGQTVTIQANQEEGKVFSHWVVRQGGVTLANPFSPQTTFTVKTITPAQPALYSDYLIVVEAIYKACPHSKTYLDGAIAPTCGANGKEADRICADCGAVITEGALIPATGEHNFQIDPATVKEGSCTRSGYSGDYVCVVCGKDGERGEYTGKVHVNTEVVGAKEATCTSTGHTGKTICSDCGAIVDKGESIPKLDHAFGEWVVTIAPGFDKAGKETRTCVNCGKAESRILEPTGSYTVKFNSNGGTDVASQSVAPGGTAVCPEAPIRAGYIFQSWYSNKALSKEYDFSTPVTENLTLYAAWADSGVDEYDITVLTEGSGTASASRPFAEEGTVITLSASPAEGYQFKGWVIIRGDIEIVDNAFTMPDEEVTVKAVFEAVEEHTHDFAWAFNSSSHWLECICSETASEGPHEGVLRNAKPATATKDGYTGDTVCAVCGYVMAEGHVIPATGGIEEPGEPEPAPELYTISVRDADNGQVSANRTSAAPGDTVTITVTPDKGYVLETLTVTAKDGSSVSVSGKNGKFTFSMPASKVTVKATFMEDNTMLNFFVDVPVDAYYYEPVLWAVEEGITTGVDDLHFSPDSSCTRGQAVTFLWRALGCPAPENREMTFEDVAPGSYCYDAVLWAVEQGITTGVTATTFCPDTPCTRSQIVTFLWRALGCPAAPAYNPFSDVPSSAYYTEAVLWAAETGVTGGTGDGLFSPAATCTRGQIVTFLYRCMK